MKKLACFLLLTVICPDLYAFDLEGVKAGDIKAGGFFDEPFSPFPPPFPPQQPNGGNYQTIQLEVRNQPSWGAVEASDLRGDINISVRKVFTDQYDVSNRVGHVSQWGSVRKFFGSDYELSGGGMSLTLREFAGTAAISGSVAGRYVNLNVSRRDTLSLAFYVSGAGINLSVDRYGVNGSYDAGQTSKEAVTAVLSILFAIQAENSSADRVPAGK